MTLLRVTPNLFHRDSAQAVVEEATAFDYILGPTDFSDQMGAAVFALIATSLLFIPPARREAGEQDPDKTLTL